MQYITAHIKRGEQSFNVANLQAALNALGYQINPDELDNQTTGDSLPLLVISQTRKQTKIKH